MFINGIVNYFFFTGEILFCVFYYFCRRYDENSEGINWGVRIKSIWMNLKEGVIGSLIASILIIPNFVALNSNPRLSNGLYGSTALVSNCIKYLNIWQHHRLRVEQHSGSLCMPGFQRQVLCLL